jgi:hypothetical protein
MRILMVLLACTVVALLGCDKNKFETTPHLEIKSINSDEIFQGQQLRVTLKYFDKEGDLSKGILTYIRVRTNTIPIPDPNNNDKIDTIRATLPEFPDKSQAEIIQNISYDFMNENPDPLSVGRSDTMYFKFTVMDKEGNASDTVATKLVIAVQP